MTTYRPAFTIVVLAAALLGFNSTARSEEAAKPQYVGVEGCATCHKSKKSGEQLAKWEAGPHSKAFETLASPKAKEIGAAKGIADPQKSDACLSCHVTAHGVDASLIATPKEGKKGHVPEQGVGCESCHGAGSEYKGRKVMKDRDAAIAAGLVIPDKAVCETCHNDKSPTYKPFNFKEYTAKIAHPKPEAPADGS